LQPARNEPRKLVTASEDAGQTFKLIGFYPNLRGGSMRLSVDLDGKGLADKTGELEVSNFQILGDPVVNEVLRLPDDNFGAGRGDRPTRRIATTRQVLPFERMRVSFAIGQGQFAFEEAELRGPLLGVKLRGKADLRERMVHLGGTYTPLQDLNAAAGEVPAVGPVLSPRGEGVFGITFAIYGSMDRPQVYVNPLSVVAPGIFRDLFPMGPPNARITPRGDKPKGNGEPQSRVRNAPAATGTAKSAGSRSDTGSSSWSSRTVPSEGR
jgi:AsmA-like C-terminal region